LTVAYFTLIFISSWKDNALDTHAAQLNRIDDENDSVNAPIEHSKLILFLRIVIKFLEPEKFNFDKMNDREKNAYRWRVAACRMQTLNMSW
jgi:hypothetical protein